MCESRARHNIFSLHSGCERACVCYDPSSLFDSLPTLFDSVFVILTFRPIRSSHTFVWRLARMIATVARLQYFIHPCFYTPGWTHVTLTLAVCTLTHHVVSNRLSPKFLLLASCFDIAATVPCSVYNTSPATSFNGCFSIQRKIFDGRYEVKKLQELSHH